MTNSVEPTTVACSYYLSAQAESAAAAINHLSDYQKSFGRSPDCTSYAAGQLSFSNCGSNTSGTLLPAIDYVPFGMNGLGAWEVPPGVYAGNPREGVLTESCCGSCVFQLDKVRLIYFPTFPQKFCAQGHNTTIEPYNMSSGFNGFGKHMHSLEGNVPRTFVSNGYSLWVASTLFCRSFTLSRNDRQTNAYPAVLHLHSIWK